MGAGPKPSGAGLEVAGGSKEKWVGLKGFRGANRGGSKEHKGVGLVAVGMGLEVGARLEGQGAGARGQG